MTSSRKWSGLSLDDKFVRTKNAPEATQKFGLLPQLSKLGEEQRGERRPDELEGEIAVSGDSQMDLQQSRSWIHDREDGDDEQVLQPKLKRKRTTRTRPRPTLDRLEDRTGSERSSLLRGGSSQLAYQADYDNDALSKTDPDLETVGMPAARHGPGNSVANHKRNMPLRGANSSKSHVVQKPVRSNSAQVSVVKSRTAGPVSPPSVGRNVRGGLGPGSIPVPRDAKFSQQSTQQNRWAHQPPPQLGGGGSGSGSGGNLGWAKPVKRMRTDTGKRRPSHL